MRIISGLHKGRRIVAPKNLPVRPTTDRAKESLFNMLHHKWEWNVLTVLDLFAGIGNMSYEFASRGVQKITAVDENRNCTQFIKKTTTTLQMPIAVVQADVLRFIEKQPQSPFDIVFADPPYDFPLEKYQKLVTTLTDEGWLGGTLIVEHQSRLKMDEMQCFAFSRTYGDTSFSFFESNKKAGL